MNQNNKQKGFALLIAVLVAGVLVAVTYMMFSISLKQMALGTSGKNSQVALFIADTGLECALYYDGQGDGSGNDVFGTINSEIRDGCDVLTDSSCIITTVNDPHPNDPNGNYLNSLSCAGQILEQVGERTATTTFKFGFTYANSNEISTSYGCAIVSVGKYVLGSSVKTNISSRGYNICPDGDNNNPLRLERGLEAFY